MKDIKLFFLAISVFALINADNPEEGISVENIKKEYGIMYDGLYAQEREKLEKKEDIVVWLYHKNKKEFKDIQNFMAALSVELCFDRVQEYVIKKELEDYLKENIQAGMQDIVATDWVTADNIQDFFHISRMICDVTLESGDTCRKMIRGFKKEYRSDIKQLKIIDKAREKVRAMEKEKKKQELLDQLREQVVLGAYPRK